MKQVVGTPVIGKLIRAECAADKANKLRQFQTLYAMLRRNMDASRAIDVAMERLELKYLKEKKK